MMEMTVKGHDLVWSEGGRGRRLVVQSAVGGGCLGSAEEPYVRRMRGGRDLTFSVETGMLQSSVAC